MVNIVTDSVLKYEKSVEHLGQTSYKAQTKFIFHNWVDSSDWRPKDLTMMTPEQGESYERRLLRERPKYVPMELEELAKLSPVSIRSTRY